MTIHLRQICLVAEKLAPVVEDLTAILAIKPCYVDPEVAHFGLENTLFPIGTDFLEVVAPVRENTAAGRYLQRRKGEGGYMVICQTRSREEQDRYRKQAEAEHVRVAWEHAYEHGGIMQLHPGDMRAAFLEIDWDAHADYSGHWHPAGGTGWEDKVSTKVVTAMTGAELQGPDPIALAQHWAAVFGNRNRPGWQSSGGGFGQCPPAFYRGCRWPGSRSGWC